MGSAAVVSSQELHHPIALDVSMCFSCLTFPIHCNALKQPQVLFVWLTTWTTCPDPCRLHSILSRNLPSLWKTVLWIGSNPFRKVWKKTSTRQLHNKIIETLSDWIFVFHQPQLAYLTGTILMSSVHAGDFSIFENAVVSRFVETTKALLPEFFFGGQAKNMSKPQYFHQNLPIFFYVYFFASVLCAPFLSTVSLSAILDS